MPNLAHAVTACEKALVTYLQGAITGLTVIPEWPAANQRLSYPSVTLTSGKVSLMNRPPEQISSTDPDGDNKVVVTEVIGEYDFKMQLDLWCANKFQRDQVLGQIFDAINAASADSTGAANPAGLSLQLTNYFNDWARFDLDGFMYMDDEAAAQRQERRVKIDLLVNCRAIQNRTYYAMVHIESHIGASDSQAIADMTTETHTVI